MTSSIKIFLTLFLCSATASQTLLSNSKGRVSERMSTAFLHKGPSPFQSKITLDKSRIRRASMIAQSRPTARAMVGYVRRTVTSKREEMQRNIFQKVRDWQWEINSQFDDAFSVGGRIAALEVFAPFIIYISVLYLAKILDAPCVHELDLLWISTVLFTMAGINNKAPSERNTKWVTYAILTHFMFCWLPLQSPFVADWLLFHEKEGLFHANQANFCHVDSFIPSALESKILDFSKFLSTCSCGKVGH